MEEPENKNKIPLFDENNPIPFSFKGHRYDVNIIACYLKLKKILEKNEGLKTIVSINLRKRYYLSQIEKGIRAYCQHNIIDFTKHFISHEPLIIPSTEYYYKFCLALSLICFDKEEIENIELFLNYQKENYQGKDSFINIVEFLIRDLIKSHTPFKDDSARLREITRWIKKERDYLKAKKSRARKKTDPPKSNIEIDENIIANLYEQLSELFSKEDSQKLKMCLEGKPIEKQIICKCNCADFVFIFYKLRMKGRYEISGTNNSIAKWMHDSFKYTNEKHESQYFDISYVKNLLSKVQPDSKRPIIDIDYLLDK
jgi:hypothetical protein